MLARTAHGLLFHTLPPTTYYLPATPHRYTRTAAPGLPPHTPHLPSGCCCAFGGLVGASYTTAVPHTTRTAHATRPFTLFAFFIPCSRDVYSSSPAVAHFARVAHGLCTVHAYRVPLPRFCCRLPPLGFLPPSRVRRFLLTPAIILYPAYATTRLPAARFSLPYCIPHTPAIPTYCRLRRARFTVLRQRTPPARLRLLPWLPPTYLFYLSTPSAYRRGCYTCPSLPFLVAAAFLQHRLRIFCAFYLRRHAVWFVTYLLQAPRRVIVLPHRYAFHSPTRHTPSATTTHARFTYITHISRFYPLQPPHLTLRLLLHYRYSVGGNFASRTDVILPQPFIAILVSSLLV